MAYNFGRNLFTSTPTAVATFNAFDIAQAVGYITLYGLKTVASGAVATHRLSTQLTFSDAVATSGAFFASPSMNKGFSGAFNIKFNRPLLIGGDTVVNVPIGAEANVGATNFGIAQPVVSLFIMDENDTQTLIVPRTSGALVAPGRVAAFGSGMTAIPITIPQTLIKAGERLRLDVEGWSKTSGGDQAQVWVAHDPQNRVDPPESTGSISGAWLYGPSQMSILLPVKIDI